MVQYFSVPNDKIRVWAIKDREQRKILHVYCDIHDIKGHRSFHIPELPYEIISLVECLECNKWSPTLTYHRGVDDSNIDEYYSGKCNYCYNTLNWECNYDYDADFVKKVVDKNVFACGPYLEKFYRYHETSLNPTDDDIHSILRNI